MGPCSLDLQLEQDDAYQNEVWLVASSVEITTETRTFFKAVSKASAIFKGFSPEKLLFLSFMYLIIIKQNHFQVSHF